ncbi:MAG TPA: alkaline phosphatase D family protein, partial [Burkholderiales bacterium]|nr:alkaline phosphatase D family protein [Burkholderiales bacterium]
MANRSPARPHVDEYCTANRRAFLRALGASALLTTTGSFFTRSAWGRPVFSTYPFALGVASGDPAPDGFVIWTRIAPKPLEPGGGMPAKPVEVAWEVATDESMKKVARKGTAIAHSGLGHSVHIELEGLAPARDYFYRFVVGGERSTVGRARTLPAAGAGVAQVRFAVCGCQRYEDGYFTAFRRLSEERFDFVFHYGDYIYEYRAVRPGERKRPVVRVMPGEPNECYTLDDYRHRYALYKLDPDLQAAHASAPFVMSFDDHEVVNDWAGDTTVDNTPRELFLSRRAAAFQAWYEHLPLRKAQTPRGPDILAYRRFAVGDLITVNVLDTRQFRSPQACADGPRVRAGCTEAFMPGRTVLGEAQERWLYDGFRDSRSRWNLLAQQIIMMRNDRDPDPDVFGPSLDKWDGAVAARDRLLAAVERAKLSNLVVVAGDIHRNFAGELKKNFANPDSATLGVEFVATSISSRGDDFDINDRFRRLLQQDPHIRFFNS